MSWCAVERSSNAMHRSLLTRPRLSEETTKGINHAAGSDIISLPDYTELTIDELEQEQKLHRGIRVNKVATLFHDLDLPDDECMDLATQAIDGDLEALSLNASAGKSALQQICEVCNEDDPATQHILLIHHSSNAGQNMEDIDFFCNNVFPFSDKRDRKHVGVTQGSEAQRAIRDFFKSEEEKINAYGALQAAIVLFGHGSDREFCLQIDEMIRTQEIESFVRKCWEESRRQRPETSLPATVMIIYAECGSQLSAGQCSKFTAVHLTTDLKSEIANVEGRKCYVVGFDSDMSRCAGEKSVQ